MSTTFLITNLSPSETKKSIHSIFHTYQTISSITHDPSCETATITFTSTPNPSILTAIIISNNKMLKVTPINKNSLSCIENTDINYHKRLFISNINKQLNILDVRNIVKKFGKIVDVNVKNAGKRKRNNGYCFVEFKDANVAERFVERFDETKKTLGMHAKVEYARAKGRKKTENEPISKHKEK